MLRMTRAFLKLNDGVSGLNVDRRLLVKSFVGEQNYFEFNSLGN